MLLICIYQDGLLAQSPGKAMLPLTGTYQTRIVPASSHPTAEMPNRVDDKSSRKADSAEKFCNACSSFAFTVGNTFTVGLEPTSLASGDLNEDGNIDIVVSNRDNDNVSVVLGDGTGNFGSPLFIAVGGQPHSVVLGDFNEDGHLDFATANLTSLTISVLLGDGTGNFGSATFYGTGVSPRTVIVGDWNADQHLDMAFTSQLSNTINIMLGNGEGVFHVMPPISVGIRPVYISSADFNNDGNADLAVSNRLDNNISVLLGDGTGSFVFRSNTSVALGTEPFISAAGDFNHDGKMDLAVKIRFSGSVAILMGDGTGAFVSQIFLPAAHNFMAMAIGDFNLDGNLDVATDNITSGVLSIYQGDGLGAFPALLTDTLPPFALLYPADYNHDGKLDLASAGYAFLNNCSAPDADGDGVSDICDICPVDPNAPSVFYADADGDGYGNIAVTIKACAAPAGYVRDSTDCNDGNAAVHPGATEDCNGIDDNCNGLTDENVTITFYLDADGDGFGSLDASTEACTVPPGYVVESTDCDDNNPAVNKGATEVCNGIDDNCDGQIDEGANTTFYADADGDGYGNIAVTIKACTAPAGYVKDGTDCDDSKTTVHPGATEDCNGIDDNCNGLTDENVTITFYLDADGDGFGSLDASTEACTVPPGYVVESTDCDDNNPAVNKGATEVCNGIDDNCDGQIDEGANTTFYADADGDGYGNIAVTINACTAPAGYVNDTTDCNDSNAVIYPGAKEVCNGMDDNCNGQIDEGCNVPPLSCSIKVSPAQTLRNHQLNTIYLGIGKQSLILTGVAKGGNGEYSYDWGAAGMGASISVSPNTTTTYTLTVKDEEGNTGTCTVTIYVVDVRCGKHSNKVTVCHHNKTLCLDYHAALLHLAHGDHLRSCNEAFPELFVKVYPNPTHNYFTVEIKSNNKKDKVKLRVIDFYSHLIEERNNVSPDQTIQMGSDYRRGVYILKVTQAGVRKSLLLIKLGNGLSNAN
ncbi:MAG TPA: MopE-related protein [Agriterribacter sp.]|nr:MopE-related protein [Agriterribacter sp.]